MTGAFSAEVKAQIAGTSGNGAAPGAATTTPATKAATSPATRAPTSTGSAPANGTSAAGNSADNDNGASSMSMGTYIAGVAVAVLSALLI